METLGLRRVVVASFGNHDFDFGVCHARTLTKEECLFKKEGRQKRARSQWIMSNMTGEGGQPLAEAEPWVVKDHAGVRVGFLAVSMNWLNLAGLSTNTTNPDKLAEWTDEVEAARHWATYLRGEQKCDLVLCLCHDEVPRTRVLSQQVPEVDFFLGGHEHIYQETDRYVIAGYDFEDFCLLTFDVPQDSVVQAPTVQRFRVPAEVPTAQELREREFTGNARRMRNLIDQYTKDLDEMRKRPLEPEVCFAEVLDTRKFMQRTQESAAGNLFADAILEAMRSHGAECALLIGGAIGAGAAFTPADTPLTWGDILSWFPWEGSACLLQVSGDALVQALEHGCKDLPRREGCFPQVSAIRFNLTVDPAVAAGEPGSPFHRVSEVFVNGAPLVKDQTYLVATTDWVAEGGDGFAMGEDLLVAPEGGPLLHEVVVKHLASLGTHPRPITEGRIRHTRQFRMVVEDGEVGSTVHDPMREAELHVRPWCS